jgi:small subunit ribosomal protein S4
MGDPRKIKSKYAGPGHPWQRARLEEERGLVREYGLATKRELWKANSKLKTFANQAKRLIALRTVQADLEKKQLLDRVARLGLLKSGAKLDDVLAITLKDLLNRRLQTLVLKKGMARTPRQSRQFIVHEHVMIGPKKISAPSYLVPVEEEAQISFVANSSLASVEHPERAIKSKPKSMIAREAAGKKPFERRGQRRPQHRAPMKPMAAEKKPDAGVKK